MKGCPIFIPLPLPARPAGGWEGVGGGYKLFVFPSCSGEQHLFDFKGATPPPTPAHKGRGINSSSVLLDSR